MKPPKEEGAGNAGCVSAPAALRAKIKSTQASHHRFAETFRHSPRNGFNGFLRALPGDRAFLPPLQVAMRKHRHPLDVSVETSGPHDFTVRHHVVRLFDIAASIASRANES
jgi:hypothetical protein